MRLRILPVYNGERGQHYLVVDKFRGTVDDAERLRAALGGAQPALIFAPRVELDDRPDVDVETACEIMHDAYEKAALGAGWETNPASRKPWADVPAANKATMRAAVSALLDYLDRSED